MRANLMGLVVPVVLLGTVAAAPVPKQKPEDVPAVTKEHLKASRTNLERIALAGHGYYDVNNKLPGNIYSKDGKTLLSWRVAILPFFEQDDLYKKFKLDEPWDSAHNKTLAEKVPKLFAPVRVRGKLGETFYQTFTGKGTVFGDKGPEFGLPNIPDGTSNTAYVVEAATPVIWTKPEDLAFDEEKALPKLGGLFDGDFHVALFDGSVMLFKKDVDEAEMKKVIMPADGNVVNLKQLVK